MSVLITKQDCNLNDSNAFYRVEAHNLGCHGRSTSGFAIPTQINTTFANAGQCLGIGVCLYGSGAVSDTDVIADLEQTRGAVTINITGSTITLASHGFSTNQKVRFTTSGALPTGLVAGTDYYVAPPREIITMTSNNQPSPYVASASGEYTTYYAYLAFDNSAATYWIVDSTTSSWLKLDFGSGRTINGYSIQARTTSYMTRTPRDWTFEGSNNDSDWDILDTRTEQTSWASAQIRYFACTNTTSYRYYRLNISSNDGDPAYTQIAQFNMYRYMDTNTFAVAASTDGTPIELSGTQSGTQTLWETKVSKTKTVTEIAGSGYTGAYATYETPFIFDTGYTITTAANTWRFSISKGSGTNTWGGLITANYTGTQAGIHYFTWCDTQMSFTDGDAVIVKDYLTIDKSARFTGVPCIAGITDYRANARYAIVCCSNPNNIDKENVALLRCTNPASGYTLAISGEISIPSYSGIQIGTENNPIPYNKQFSLIFTGTSIINGISAFGDTGSAGLYGGINQTFLFYGETQTNRSALIPNGAPTGQNKITTDIDTTWQIGDKVIMGPIDYLGHSTTVLRTIAGISGAEITLDANFTYTLLSGATIYNREKYGIIIRGATTSIAYITACSAANLIFSGVHILYPYINIGKPNTTVNTNTIASSHSRYQIIDCHIYAGTTTGIYYTSADILGIDIKRNHCYYSFCAGCFAYCYYGHPGEPGDFDISDNIMIAPSNSTSPGVLYYLGGRPPRKIKFHNNKIYNGLIGTDSFIRFCGYKNEIYNNDFYGINRSAGYYAAVDLVNIVDCISSGNTFNKCSLAFGNYSGSYIANFRSINDTFGNISANTIDIEINSTLTLFEAYIINPITPTPIIIDDADLPYLDDYVHLYITNDTQIQNNDHSIHSYGYIRRCGEGLDDTTVRTSGSDKYSIRFQPIRYGVPLIWTFNIPTGNIQGQSITLGVWVKINSANYYSGYHLLPLLTVNYDNNQYTITGQTSAQTEWQYISTTFIPSTTFSSVNVTLSADTDQSGSDAYVYWDDFVVDYPEDASVNLSSFDMWYDASPVTPPVTILTDNLLPPVITLISVTNPSSADNDGEILIEATSGKTPYEYSIGYGFQTGNTFTGLSGSTYVVSVKDANNLYDVISGITLEKIFQPPVITLISVTNPGSADNDGEILIEATSGKTPYEYSIGYGFQTGNTFNNLSSGTYVVSVKDANNLYDIVSGITLTKGSVSLPYIAGITITDCSARNVQDGKITIVASGGTPSYQYSLNGIDYRVINTFTSLPSNVYTIYVKDSTGTVTSLSGIEVGKPPAITGSIGRKVDRDRYMIKPRPIVRGIIFKDKDDDINEIKVDVTL